MHRYASCRRSDECLRLKGLAEQYPRYGFPTLHGLLKAEGLVQNRKRTYRIYREEGLQVRTKRRKKLARPRVPMPVPGGIDERWSMDFVSDQRSSGRRIQILNWSRRTRVHLHLDLAEARRAIDDWRVHYNEVRPHRSLGKPPAVFARMAA